jgi:DegV family protein with EDD domain
MVRQSESVFKRKYNIVIVTDSTCDLAEEIIDKYQIHVLPVNISFGENHYLDKITLKSEKFYELLGESPSHPKSSQINEKSFVNLYSHLASHYDSVIAVNLSDKLSGTFHTSQKAAQMVSREFNKPITVINSKGISGFIGLIVLRIAESIEKGMPHEKIVESAEKWINDTKIFVTVLTLKYLIMGGRLSFTKGLIARLLHVSPIISVDESGKAVVFDKAFNRNQHGEDNEPCQARYQRPEGLELYRDARQQSHRCRMVLPENGSPHRHETCISHEYLSHYRSECRTWRLGRSCNERINFLMSFIQIWFQVLGVILILMTILWVVSILIKNVSIVDLFWGAGFVITAVFYFLSTQGENPRKILLLSLVTLWGLRLSGYLSWRNIGKCEDFRYREFRKKYDENRYWWVSFFQTFLLQGVLMWLISAPLLGAMFYREQPFPGIFDFAAILFWIIGFIFEAGGDFQLAKFRSHPSNKGKVLDTGFWKYTRHPNYFGDSSVWWGYGLFCVAAGSYFPVLGSVLMTAVIIKVSGVALLERSLSDQKPQYKDYIERTSAFIPWFTKRK